jgi:hypothetical protein
MINSKIHWSSFKTYSTLNITLAFPGLREVCEIFSTKFQILPQIPPTKSCVCFRDLHTNATGAMSWQLLAHYVAPRVNGIHYHGTASFEEAWISKFSCRLWNLRSFFTTTHEAYHCPHIQILEVRILSWSIPQHCVSSYGTVYRLHTVDASTPNSHATHADVCRQVTSGTSVVHV